MRRPLPIALVSLLATFALSPATAQAPDRGSPAGPAVDPSQHWAVRMGRRAWERQQKVPVVGRVVLVPDEATYLDEIAKWSPNGQWPVLFEDDHLAPLFIRRFQPTEIRRRESVAAGLADPAARRAAYERTLAEAWSSRAKDGVAPDAASAGEEGPEPLGVVFASVNDPARTAAIALAAGRGQRLAWLEGDYGRPNGSMTAERAASLSREIAAALDATGRAWKDLGDEIDAITLCRNLAGRVESPTHSPQKSDFLAVTDALGRAGDDRRRAFVGWIFGDEARGAYAAMASLFLPRTDVTLYNTYPTEGTWSAFDVLDAGVVLSRVGYNVRTERGPGTDEAGWLRFIGRGLDGDVLLMNTKGNAEYFDLHRGRGYPGDVPVLNEPVAVHLVHSWSLRSPESTDTTVGGAWLETGAYALVGSVQEPYLAAFVPPSAMARRLGAGIPFLVAARHWEKPPWKVNTIGDPLMVCGPARERIDAPSTEGVDLRALLPRLMREADANPSDEAFARAISLATLTGQDGVAAELYRLAKSKGAAGAATSDAALPALFRIGRSEAFVEAFQIAPRPDELRTNMLWHMLLPRIMVRAEDEALLLLRSSLREPLTHADIERLGPHLRAAFGEGFYQTLLQEELNRTRNDLNRRQLERLLGPR